MTTTTNTNNNDDNDNESSSSSLYDDIMNDPITFPTEYQVLTELRSKYGETISKDEYLAKLDEISDTVVKEWDDDFEYFTEYGDGTIVVDSKGIKKCGWCGIELGDDVLSSGELCASCNKLPKKITPDGPFRDTKLYVKDNKEAPGSVEIQEVEYRYMIDDD